jgi:hypothetical protein
VIVYKLRVQLPMNTVRKCWALNKLCEVSRQSVSVHVYGSAVEESMAVDVGVGSVCEFDETWEQVIPAMSRHI